MIGEHEEEMMVEDRDESGNESEASSEALGKTKGYYTNEGLEKLTRQAMRKKCTISGRS